MAVTRDFARKKKKRPVLTAEGLTQKEAGKKAVADYKERKAAEDKKLFEQEKRSEHIRNIARNAGVGLATGETQAGAKELLAQRAAAKAPTAGVPTTAPTLTHAQQVQQDAAARREAFQEKFGAVGRGLQSETAQKVALAAGGVGVAAAAAPAIAAAGAGSLATAKASLFASTAAKATGFLPTAIKWGAAAWGLFGVKTFADIPEKRIQDVNAELTEMKSEGRTYIKMIALGPEGSIEVLNWIDEMRLTFTEYERIIKRENKRSYTSQLLGYGGYGQVQQRLKSMKRYFIPIEQLAARGAEGGDIFQSEIDQLSEEEPEF